MGPKSSYVICTRELASLQARPHIVVTSQYTVQWKLHKSFMRYLSKYCTSVLIYLHGWDARGEAVVLIDSMQ